MPDSVESHPARLTVAQWLCDSYDSGRDDHRLWAERSSESRDWYFCRADELLALLSGQPGGSATGVQEVEAVLQRIKQGLRKALYDAYLNGQHDGQQGKAGAFWVNDFGMSMAFNEIRAAWADPIYGQPAVPSPSSEPSPGPGTTPPELLCSNCGHPRSDYRAASPPAPPEEPT